VAGRGFDLRANSTKTVEWVFTKDLDGNGRSDAGEPVVTTSGLIPGGGRALFVARGRLPAVALDRSIDTTAFSASSTTNQSNTAQCLAITTIGRPVMTLVKSAVAPNPVAGGEILYRIVYANHGSGHAERFRAVDTLPPNTSFVAGSLKVNSVTKTDAADADEATVSSNVLTVEIGAVAPDAAGVIEFKVRID
jgi:uncharacterized repeat protein (TIGR01451 family)